MVIQPLNYKSQVCLIRFISAQVGGYTVYKDELWRVIGRIGDGKDFAIELEQKKAGKTIWVKGKEGAALRKAERLEGGGELGHCDI